MVETRFQGVDTQRVDTTASERRTVKLPSPVRMLRDRAERYLAARLRAVFDHVDDTFFDLADNADSSQQQTWYFDAMRIIRMRRTSIQSAFLRTISQAYDYLIYPNTDATGSSAGSENGFELVADDELEEIIALDTMVSKAEEVYKKDLQYLVKRLDSLAMEAVTFKNNPLGPDLVCDAFFKATETLEIGIRSKLVLLKLFDRHVISSFDELYAQSNQLLGELGILPELEKARPDKPKAATARPVSRSSRGRAHSADAGESSHQDSHQGSHQDYGRLVTQLNSVLSRYDSSGAAGVTDRGSDGQPLDESHYLELDDVLGAITRLQSDAGRKLDGNQSSLTDAIFEQLSEIKDEPALRVPEKAVINLVDSLFERVRGEQGYSPMLDSEMRDLELAIMKIALRDPSFFDKERHPARRLLNEVAQVSMAFGDEDTLSADPLYVKIHEVLAHLQKVEADNATLTRLLTDFIAFIEKEHRRSAVKEQRLLEEETAKERLNYSHHTVRGEIEGRLVGLEVPATIVSFAEQAWSKVMFHAHLREGAGSDAWRSAIQILDEVIDLSVLGHEAFPLRKAMQLLESVRIKLEDVSLDPYQTEHLIRGMEQLLQAGVAGTIAEMERTLVEAIYPDIPGEPFVQDDDIDSEELGESHLHEIGSISPGTWVEIQKGDNKRQRARFAGVVNPSDKLIFVNRKGVKVAEGSRRRLAVELKNERLVVLDNSPLFDRALAGIVRDARARKPMGKASGDNVSEQ